MSINPTAERLLNTIEGRIESFNGVTITLREDLYQRLLQFLLTLVFPDKVSLLTFFSQSLMADK